MAFTVDDWKSDFTTCMNTVTTLSQQSPPSPTSVSNVSRATARLRLRLDEVMREKREFGVGEDEGDGMKRDMEDLEIRVKKLNATPPHPTSPDPTLTAYHQTAQTVMSAQDDLLNQLGTGVTRLHDQALMINEESTLHVNLLNDMDEDVESATMGLRQEAKHAERIREQSSVCKLYLVIAAETGLLVFLVIMGFSH